jgi:hypothetical protein
VAVLMLLVMLAVVAVLVVSRQVQELSQQPLTQ